MSANITFLLNINYRKKKNENSFINGIYLFSEVVSHIQKWLEVTTAIYNVYSIDLRKEFMSRPYTFTSEEIFKFPESTIGLEKFTDFRSFRKTFYRLVYDYSKGNKLHWHYICYQNKHSRN